MNTTINVKGTDTEQENLLDLPFEELLTRSPGGGNDQFLMRIEVNSKTVSQVLDKYGQPYIEIAVDYVTVPKGKQKTKRTRPTFQDGQLIWEKVSAEPSVNYLVTLTRSSDPKKPYYNWTKVVRLNDDNDQSTLINALTAEDKSELGATNEPTFKGAEGEGTDPPPINSADKPTSNLAYSDG